MAHGSIAELMANQPDFNQMKIRGGESPYSQPVIPGERRLLPEMQEKLRPALPPVRKAANDLMEEYIAQLAPQNVRNVTAPSSMPYIKTPSEKNADKMLMQRLGNQLSPDDVRFFLEGNYGYSGV